MKIIDLLNKIANGEEVPKEIIYDNRKYFWCSQCKIYERVEDSSKDLYNDLGDLNDEVEILGDEKNELPKKLKGLVYPKEIYTKINEIIDYLEKQGKGE